MTRTEMTAAINATRDQDDQFRGDFENVFDLTRPQVDALLKMSNSAAEFISNWSAGGTWVDAE